jgi:CDP-glucose 4,6-dehydratase
MLTHGLKSINGPILVTGHTGFKGSWLSLLLNHLGIEYFGYSLEAEEDSLYRRVNLESMSKGVVGDIRDLENLSKVIKNVRPSVIIHLAAQPLVLKSYQDPLETFQTNCMGTANILEAAFDTPSVEVVLAITTDKVYRNNNSGRRFVESDPLEGKDPYSASKVAAEAVCAAWQQISKISGGPKVIVARAGNVIGGGDFAKDRLIPDAIRALMSEQNLLVRSPEATRPWQHVLDPLIGYLTYIEKTLQGETKVEALNFGPNERSLEVAKVLDIGQEILDNRLRLVLEEFELNKEAKVLQLDTNLAKLELSWNPRWRQAEAIRNTFFWWESVLSNEESAFSNCLKDIESFLT